MSQLEGASARLQAPTLRLRRENGDDLAETGAKSFHPFDLTVRREPAKLRSKVSKKGRVITNATHLLARRACDSA